MDIKKNNSYNYDYYHSYYNSQKPGHHILINANNSDYWEHIHTAKNQVIARHQDSMDDYPDIPNYAKRTRLSAPVSLDKYLSEYHNIGTNNTGSNGKKLSTCGACFGSGKIKFSTGSVNCYKCKGTGKSDRPIIESLSEDSKKKKDLRTGFNLKHFYTGKNIKVNIGPHQGKSGQVKTVARELHKRPFRLEYFVELEDGGVHKFPRNMIHVVTESAKKPTSYLEPILNKYGFHYRPDQRLDAYYHHADKSVIEINTLNHNNHTWWHYDNFPWDKNNIHQPNNLMKAYHDVSSLENYLSRKYGPAAGPAAVAKSTKNCPDCKGKKLYYPLVGPAENCTRCQGKGTVNESRKTYSELFRILNEASDKKLEFISTRYQIKGARLKHLRDMDPTDSDYLPWLAKHTQAGNIRLPEDKFKIGQQIQAFHRLKKSPKYTGQKDINQIRHPSKLYDLLDKHRHQRSEKETHLDIGHVIYQQDDISVHKLSKKEMGLPEATRQLMNASSNTNWCTAHEHDAKRFIQTGSIYHIRKQGKPIAQLHPHTGQFMNTKDEPIHPVQTDKPQRPGYQTGETRPDLHALIDHLSHTDKELVPYIAKRNLMYKMPIGAEHLDNLTKDKIGRELLSRSPHTPPEYLHKIAIGSDKEAIENLSHRTDLPPAIRDIVNGTMSSKMRMLRDDTIQHPELEQIRTKYPSLNADVQRHPGWQGGVNMATRKGTKIHGLMQQLKDMEPATTRHLDIERAFGTHVRANRVITNTDTGMQHLRRGANWQQLSGVVIPLLKFNLAEKPSRGQWRLTQKGHQALEKLGPYTLEHHKKHAKNLHYDPSKLNDLPWRSETEMSKVGWEPKKKKEAPLTFNKFLKHFAGKGKKQERNE
jgi:hypothetical protein